jgi:preprotein translocase subunit SecD
MASVSGANGALWAQDSGGGANPVGEERCSLANGVYAVLGEGLTRGAARQQRVPQTICIYDQKYSASDEHQPAKYVALDDRSFVPLVLAGAPEAHTDDGGRTLLRVTLARQHVTQLEEFTRTHLGGRVAIVIDGEIITIHKVRTVIPDGQVQITRCNDNACEVLRLKLAK